jgi:multiple sugar transport system ATP-binding protein
MNLLGGTLVPVDDRLTFDDWDTCLVAASRPDWVNFVGRPLLLGIRPEDVTLVEGPGEDRLRMVVRFVERLGPVQVATVEAGAWTVTARLAVASAALEGETVFAAFNLARAHLFDPATGRALCHGR